MSGTWERKVTVTVPSDGDGAFAECSADRHSTKGTPMGPHSIFCAECARQHSAKKGTFAECLWAGHSTKEALVGLEHILCVECTSWHSAKISSLLSATTITLDNEPLPVPRCIVFAECYGHCTRQRHSLLSVTLDKVTRDPTFLFVFVIPSIQTKDIYH
jgi:hypothetical protein